MQTDYDNEIVGGMPWYVLKIILPYQFLIDIDSFINSLNEEDHVKFETLLRTDTDLCEHNWDYCPVNPNTISATFQISNESEDQKMMLELDTLSIKQ